MLWAIFWTLLCAINIYGAIASLYGWKQFVVVGVSIIALPVLIDARKWYEKPRPN